MSGFRVGNGLTQTAVTVTTAATLLRAAGALRKSVLVKHAGVDGTMYVGDATVTASTGFPLEAGGSVNFDDYNGAVYGITATGSVPARVLEVL